MSYPITNTNMTHTAIEYIKYKWLYDDFIEWETPVRKDRKEYLKEWIKNNKDKILEKRRKWREENRESINLKAKEYRDSHPEYKEYQKEYQKRKFLAIKWKPNNNP